MPLTKIVAGFSLALCATVSIADTENLQGSFSGEVSDGSELVKYENFLDSLKHWGIWANLSHFMDGSSSGPKFEDYAKTSEMLLEILEENGAKELPRYDVDLLNIGGLSGYRNFVKSRKANSSFVSNSETCGAALKFVLPESIAVTLFKERPAFVEQPESMSPYMEYRTKLTEDLASISFMCSESDKAHFKPALPTFYENFFADIDRVIPDADKSYSAFMAAQQSRTPVSPYTAMISCGMNGQNYNVLACFKDTELKISTAAGGKLYKVYNLSQAGTMTQQGLQIPLPEHFELKAQNSQSTLVMTVLIKDSSGKVVFSDEQGHWGVVSVRN